MRARSSAIRTAAEAAWLAVLLFALFALFVLARLARLAHTWAYATAQNHEVRASFYAVGSVIVIVMFMAIWVLAVAVL